MKRWTYKVVKLSTDLDELDDQLETLGKDGWELTSANPVNYSSFSGKIVPSGSNDDYKFILGIFKKELE